jgi:hypothetical protein
MMRKIFALFVISGICYAEPTNKTNFYDHVDFVYVNNIGMEIDVKKYENISFVKYYKIEMKIIIKS